MPLIGTRCGSPDGIPLGYALPGRTLERLDPFDERHPNHLLLINGMSGAGKTMSAIILIARAIAHGATGFIIDRAGHFAYLASLIPGSVSVQIGADGHAINAWDVPDPRQPGAEKIDYLLALHALLLGEHNPARDSYGLNDLESNLLGLAIGDIYERCALTGEEPRELLLQDELERRYHAERAEGSIGIAEALRNLSMRINNYLQDGPYGYLGDRPTTIPAGSPLVVFDTRLIPDAKAPAALFVICEHVKSQINTLRRAHLAGRTGIHAWSGRSFLVIDEAWKLIERPATGRWFNEFCRRSRHYALWLVAISQQLSDFDNEHGRALLANAAMRLFLRQEARELGYAKQALGLSEQAVEAISQLQTRRGRYATAYLMNGARGQATIQIAVGAREYWIATSDPARDERTRQQALADAGHDPWQALELLADESRQQGTRRAGQGSRVSQAKLAYALLRDRTVRGLLIGALALIVLTPVILAAAVAGIIGEQEAAGCASAPLNLPAGGGAIATGHYAAPLALAPGRTYLVGATEYGGPGDPSSGDYGSIPDPSQSYLPAHPDTFAELSLLDHNPANTGSFTFADADALDRLPYLSGLRVSHDGHTLLLYKRDIGYGQGPGQQIENGEPYRLDVWWQSAQPLHITKSAVQIQLAPASGAAGTLQQLPESTEASTGEASTAGCQEGETGADIPLALVPGTRTRILPSGLAAAGEQAPRQVKQMVAAGNRLYGTAYLYGAGHGPSLNTLQGAYDCSSAVSYVLHAGGQLRESALDSTELAGYGQPGPGRYITIYANSAHAFMYVAGLRLDTVEDPAWDRGPNAGKPGARWRVSPTVPDWAAWSVRHPTGL